MSFGQVKAPEWFLERARLLKLTPSEAIFVASMCELPRLSPEVLRDRLIEAGSLAEADVANNLAVLLSRLTRKLAKHSIAIHSDRQRSERGRPRIAFYWLDEKDRAALSAPIKLPPDHVPPAWRLSDAQTIVAKMLRHNAMLPGQPLLSREQAKTALIAAGYFGAAKSIDVHVTRLRGKLAAFGVVIEHVVGRGWRLVQEPQAGRAP